MKTLTGPMCGHTTSWCSTLDIWTLFGFPSPAAEACIIIIIIIITYPHTLMSSWLLVDPQRVELCLQIGTTVISGFPPGFPCKTLWVVPRAAPFAMCPRGIPVRHLKHPSSHLLTYLHRKNDQRQTKLLLPIINPNLNRNPNANPYSNLSRWRTFEVAHR